MNDKIPNKRYTKFKKKKRDTERYPALKPNLNLKTRQDEIDIDYLHKISHEEAAWLNKFNEEYVNATLDRKNLKNNINNTKEMKQAIDKRNNARKADLFTREKASGNLKYTSDLLNKKNSVIDDYEDKLIAKLDAWDEEA